MHPSMTRNPQPQVRAQLIDKTKDPKWSPRDVGGVDSTSIEALFDPVQDELSFGGEGTPAKRARSD